MVNSSDNFRKISELEEELLKNSDLDQKKVSKEIKNLK